MKQNVLTTDMPKGTKLKDWKVYCRCKWNGNNYHILPKLDTFDQIQFLQREDNFWLCHLILNGKITVAYLTLKK